MNDSSALELPLTEKRARELKLGDTVYLRGEVVITSGIPTFQRILNYHKAGKTLPVDLNNGALFHLVGYNRELKGRHEVLYLNPTTSTRFNNYMPDIIRALNLRAVGGKGGLDLESVKAMKDVGCVYLSFLGGGSPLLSASIKECLSVEWDDLIPHYRLVRLLVDGLGPALVSIDAHGNSMYERVRLGVEKNIPQILKKLHASEPDPSMLHTD
jgi:fumarate hydratase subunit beta